MLDERDPECSALRGAADASPADDLPSLVLADWLEEHGEADRAELLRIEVALKSATECTENNCGSCEPCRLLARAGELRWAIHNAAWAAVLARFKPPAGIACSPMRMALIGLQRDRSPLTRSLIASVRRYSPETIVVLPSRWAAPKTAPIAIRARWFPRSLREPVAECRLRGEEWRRVGRPRPPVIASILYASRNLRR